MTRIAFYAPLKPPTHSVPSGDRAFARSLMTAIGADAATVDLVSELRIYDRRGDATLQSELIRQADAEITRLTKELASSRPDVWVTYHNYYKAPDLIGPSVCKALDLPYVQIESTRSTSRLTGPWASFAAAAEAATDVADLVFYLTANDLITLKRESPTNQELVHLLPFLPVETLPDVADCGAPNRPMLAAGMMRAGDKLSSYQIIADTLTQLSHPGWTLHIAGDGPARPQVEEMMSPFGTQVRFLDQLDPAGMVRAYQESALFFWPGVNEAFGMVYLEAQAAGLPVVAQDRPGVRDILLPGVYPEPEAGPAALAATLSHLLSSPDLRRSHGIAARNMIAKTHLLGSARETFWSAVTPLIGTRQ